MNKYFYLDLRSLGLFRIIFGFILIYDLVTRFSDREFHYTNQGILPLDFIHLNVENLWGYSVYFMADNPTFLNLIFIYQLLLCICFTLGYKTKFSQIMIWILLGSLQDRNPFINYGGDQVLLCILFITLFLPLDHKFGLSKKHTSYDRFYSLPCVLFIVQIAYIYFFAALSKNGTSWWDGSAVSIALSLEPYSNYVGQSLLQYPSILTILTYNTLLIEYLTPFLILHHRTRLIGILLIVFLHLGFLLTMNLGIFPYVCLASLIPLIPFFIWDLKLTTKEYFLFQKNKFLSITCLFLFLVITNSNILTLFKANKDYDFLATLLSLDQEWNMFSPNPSHEIVWFVLSATLADNSQIDLLNNARTVSMKKPTNLRERLINDRWSEYFYKISIELDEKHFNQCTQFFINRYKHKNNISITKAELYLLSHSTQKNRHVSPIKHVLFYDFQ